MRNNNNARVIMNQLVAGLSSQCQNRALMSSCRASGWPGAASMNCPHTSQASSRAVNHSIGSRRSSQNYLQIGRKLRKSLWLADNQGHEQQRLAGQYLLFARLCSSCNVLKQELPSNRLPGSATNESLSESSSLSRDDHEEGAELGGRAKADDRRRQAGVAVVEATPRVTLFKKPRHEPTRPPGVQGQGRDNNWQQQQDWRKSTSNGCTENTVHNQAPLGDINRVEQSDKTSLRFNSLDPSDLKGSREPSEQLFDGLSTADSKGQHSTPLENSRNLSHHQQKRQADSSLSSRLLASKQDYARIQWRAARNYQQTDHYDHSLFGLNVHLDKAVALHQREAMLYNQDRHLKEEQAKQVAPNLKQSPISIMSLNPAYELQNKPLILDYPATVENLRLNNTGFSWEVKIPYQISMTTALHGAHLNQTHRFRLDQFHCHWGDNGSHGGSEHTVDNRSYSAEMHFVHYNMEKYHTLSKAARHSDGLVVMSVFIDAQPDHHNHAELEKIVANLKSIPLKGEHAIIRQAVRIENLLPTNRSYWSYQGSLTTPPYLESVTWFVLKQPIRCNTAQIEKFKTLSSTVRRDDEPIFIRSNFRKTQPLNGRTIVMYDEPSSSSQNGPRNM